MWFQGEGLILHFYFNMQVEKANDLLNGNVDSRFMEVKSVSR